MISLGARYLPDTKLDVENEVYAKIEHAVNKRQDGFFEIINMQWQTVKELTGIGLLGANQQVYNEACKVLYRGNTFVINTAFVHYETSLEIDSHSYPGFPNRNGSPATASQNDRRTQKLLRKGRHTEFAKYDPLLTFLRKIGPYKASLIRLIKVNGQFKTGVASLADVSFADLKRYHRKLPFADILEVYAYVLGTACTDLRTLTLGQSVGGELDYSPPWLWPVVNEQLDGERFSEVTEKIAKGLPTLQRLQLCHYNRPWEDLEDKTDMNSRKNSAIVSNDPWGVAVQWSTFVKDREMDRGFGKGSKSKSGEKIAMQVVRDRVFTLPPASIQGELPPGQVHHSREAVTCMDQNLTMRAKEFPKPLNRPTESERHQYCGMKKSSDQKRKNNRTQAPPKMASKTQNSFALLMMEDEDDEEENEE